jgi:PAS domain S-box-containing protein
MSVLAADPAEVCSLLVEHGRGLICMHDSDGLLLYINPAAATALGYQPEELIGTDLRDLLHSSVRREFEAYVERIWIRGHDSGSMRLLGRDGQPQVWSYDNVRHQLADGGSVVLGHAVDVTTDRNERAARERDERYRAFIAGAGAGICRFELERSLLIDGEDGEVREEPLIEELRSLGFVGECNDAFARLYGAGTAAEMTGVPLRNFALFRDPRNLVEIRELIRNRFAATEMECHEVSVSGSPRQFRVSATGIVVDGSLRGLWALLSDVTESKRLEAEADQSRRLLRLVERLLAAQGEEADEIAEQLSGALGDASA